ncbi:unnamed protein product [Vitrella brassicaformis CCMP3155]|uniref:RWD domain-containing protein n=1 Tax=Vitrella brassicaformis (strain CCMP3155) TaxID=1169540 RepID=A0A0G4EEU4_VITBC|nr:unnamed protein product [Vitrella brassicaformis CCMP3155]|eukprot:CEL94531.1 unnamed protein product [Vitrella brassicaformis CCMP3155]
MKEVSIVVEQDVYDTQREFIESTYEDVYAAVDGPPVRHFKVDVYPYTAGDHKKQLVRVVLECRWSPSSHVLSVKLINSRGIDEVQEDELMGICEAFLSGDDDASLFGLVAALNERVTAMQATALKGDCPICMTPLRDDDQQQQHQDDAQEEDLLSAIVRIGSCLHLHHRECLVSWWFGTEAGRRAWEKETSEYLEHLAAVEAGLLDPSQLERKAFRCAICRAEASMEEVEALVPHWLAKSRVLQALLDSLQQDDSRQPTHPSSSSSTSAPAPAQEPTTHTLRVQIEQPTSAAESDNAFGTDPEFQRLADGLRATLVQPFRTGSREAFVRVWFSSRQDALAALLRLNGYRLQSGSGARLAAAFDQRE